MIDKPDFQPMNFQLPRGAVKYAAIVGGRLRANFALAPDETPPQIQALLQRLIEREPSMTTHSRRRPDM